MLKSQRTHYELIWYTSLFYNMQTKFSISCLSRWLTDLPDGLCRKIDRFLFSYETVWGLLELMLRTLPVSCIARTYARNNMVVNQVCALFDYLDYVRLIEWVISESGAVLPFTPLWLLDISFTRSRRCTNFIVIVFKFCALIWIFRSRKQIVYQMYYARHAREMWTDSINSRKK